MKLFGKQVEAVLGTGGRHFTGRVVAYSGEPMYWIELPDGSKQWWNETLVKPLTVGPDEVWLTYNEDGKLFATSDHCPEWQQPGISHVRYRRVEE